MHDIDRNMLETGYEGENGGFEMGNFEYQQYETPGLGHEWSGEREQENFEAYESYETYDGEGVFNESEEMELAAELLEITNEQELDQFLGKLIRRAGRAVGKFVKSPIGQAVGGVLKGAVSKALPLAGGALGTMVGGPLGGMIGKGLASAAGGALGLEHESLSHEDREFEGAKQFVRLAGATVQNAAAAGPNVDPRSIAQSAVSQAARSFAPGLLQSTEQGRVSGGAAGRGRGGRWMRRGNRIVLFGV